MVHLANEKATADIEGDIERRGVRLRHLYSLERNVRALVHNFNHRGLEEQREVGAGQQDDDEAIQRDLAEHEGPMIWENLTQTAAEETIRTESFV